MKRIRAATFAEASDLSASWVFVDIGFASKAKSCGLLVGSGQPLEMTFSHLQSFLVCLCAEDVVPVNLVIEAPLSIAFNAEGNPTGRSVELRNGKSRYWYVGLGCSVLVASTHLMRSILEAPRGREIRLVEGLVSFKAQGVASSHSMDVLALREIALQRPATRGRIIPASALKLSSSDRLESAFAVAGMDFGIPPVLSVE